MAWKFLNIAKANAEIERLEAELAKTKATPPPPASAADDKRIEDMTASIAALGDNVATIGAQITALETKLGTELARVDKALTDYKADAEKIGTRLAAEITARQGQPPLNPGTTAGTTTGGGADILAQYNAISDPIARTEWYRKNKAAYDAAWSAAANKR